MRLVLALAASVGAVVLFAHGASAQQSTTTVTTQKITDSDYVRQTAGTVMFEIQAGEIALKQSNSSAVKRFAQRMIDDHTASTKKLTKLLQMANANIAPPTELDEQHKAMLQRLRNSSGSFDRTYIKMQVDGHRQALEIQKAYAQTGANPKLRQFADTATTMVKSHLAEAEKIDQSISAQ